MPQALVKHLKKVLKALLSTSIKVLAPSLITRHFKLVAGFLTMTKKDFDSSGMYNMFTL